MVTLRGGEYASMNTKSIQDVMEDALNWKIRQKRQLKGMVSEDSLRCQNDGITGKNKLFVCMVCGLFIEIP